MACLCPLSPTHLSLKLHPILLVPVFTHPTHTYMYRPLIIFFSSVMPSFLSPFVWRPINSLKLNLRDPLLCLKYTLHSPYSHHTQYNNSLSILLGRPQEYEILERDYVFSFSFVQDLGQFFIHRNPHISV